MGPAHPRKQRRSGTMRVCTTSTVHLPSQPALGNCRPESVFRRVAVRIVPVFFFIALLCQVAPMQHGHTSMLTQHTTTCIPPPQLDRSNLSFAALQMFEDLHWNKKVYGFGSGESWLLSHAALLYKTTVAHRAFTIFTAPSGLFFIGYAFFQLPSNLCCMLIGAPRWLAIIVTAWGGVACLFATLHSKIQFYVLRFLLGMVRCHRSQTCGCGCVVYHLMMMRCNKHMERFVVGANITNISHNPPHTQHTLQVEAGAYPAMYHHMLHFFSDQELGVAYTCTASATAVAGLVGGPIAAGCLCMDGLGGLAGWQWLFLLEGIPTMLFGISIPVRALQYMMPLHICHLTLLTII